MHTFCSTCNIRLSSISVRVAPKRGFYLLWVKEIRITPGKPNNSVRRFPLRRAESCHSGTDWGRGAGLGHGGSCLPCPPSPPLEPPMTFSFEKSWELSCRLTLQSQDDVLNSFVDELNQSVTINICHCRHCVRLIQFLSSNTPNDVISLSVVKVRSRRLRNCKP